MKNSPQKSQDLLGTIILAILIILGLWFVTAQWVELRIYLMGRFTPLYDLFYDEMARPFEITSQFVLQLLFDAIPTLVLFIIGFIKRSQWYGKALMIGSGIFVILSLLYLFQLPLIVFWTLLRHPNPPDFQSIPGASIPTVPQFPKITP